MTDEPTEYDYLSQEWIDAVAAAIRDQIEPGDIKRVSSSMKNVYDGCPDGKRHYFYLKFEDGALTDAMVGCAGDPVESADAEFTIMGDYATFVKISRAELGARSALMRNKIKLKGNMLKALRLSGPVDRINKVVATVPTRFASNEE